MHAPLHKAHIELNGQTQWAALTYLQACKYVCAAHICMEASLSQLSNQLLLFLFLLLLSSFHYHYHCHYHYHHHYYFHYHHHYHYH